MRNYTMSELEALTLKLRDTLDQWGNPPTARARVGRLWWGTSERWPDSINTRDAEMANALWVLSSPEQRDLVLERFDWLATDSADLRNLLASQAVGQGVTDTVDRAARWLYLNKTFWWPHLAHGWLGREGTTDWETLIDAWRHAAKSLQNATIATRPVAEFVAREDRQGVVVVLDLTADEPRRDQMTPWLTLAKKATTLLIMPEYKAETRTLAIPVGWCRQALAGTIVAANRPFRTGYQQALIPWATERPS